MMVDSTAKARESNMWRFFERNLIYFVFCLFLMVLAISLDFAYYGSLGKLASIAAFCIGIIFLFLSRKIFLYYLLTVFLIFDDSPKILYDPGVEFNSIGTVKVFNISLLFWLFILVSGSLLAWFFLRKKIGVPSIVWPLIVVVFIQLISSGVYQIFSGNGITLSSLNSVIPIFLFLLFFIFTFNQSLDSKEINKMFGLFWLAVIAKLLSYVFLVLFERYVVILGALGQTSFFVFRNSSFSFLTIFIFVLLIFAGKRSGLFKHLIGIPVLFLLAVGFFLSIQRGAIISVSLGVLFYFSLYLKKPLVFAKKISRLVVLIVLVISIAGMGNILFNVDMGKYSNKLLGFARAAEEIATLNVLGGTEQLRYVELVNIFMSNAESVYSFFFGKGIGGFFEMKYVRHTQAGSLEETDYSQGQRYSGKFYSPHSFFNVFLLKSGVVGLSFYLFFCYLTASFFFKKGQRILYNRDFMSLNIILFGIILLPGLLMGMPAGFKGNVVLGVLYGLIYLSYSRYITAEKSKGDLKCQES